MRTVARAASRREALGLGMAAASLALAPPVRAGRATSAKSTLQSLLVQAAAADARPQTFVDPFAGEALRRRLESARATAAGLAGIDRQALEPIDRIAWDVLAYRTDQTLAEARSGVTEIERLTPLDPSFGPQVEFPDRASAEAASEADLAAGLERLEAFATYLQAAVGRMREGLAQGYVQPRILAQHVLDQTRLVLAQPPEATPFFQPLARPAPSLSEAARAKWAPAYLRTIRTRVLPGYGLWADFISGTYLPAARETPGLVAMKDGPKLYDALLRRHTTTELDAQAIHQFGLSEVARIREALEAVRGRLGERDLPSLFSRVRADRSLYFDRPEDLLARFRQIEARIWQGIPRQFDRRPSAPFEVRPLPTLGAARGTGYYRLGPPDGRSPGVLYFNMAMLSTRPIPTLETLTLHEGIPGHHFQGSLAQENTALPDILRFGQNGFTAYVEGWGLYAESLGPALGMFEDPWQLFGHLDFEMLRAVRLVVDTGVHADGWSRQRAIAYMTDNTSMAARDIEVEIDRYIAAPGQATAYKVGERQILTLRERARTALAGRFDIRAFHDQVLMTGALPLRTLETKIDGWIASGGPAYEA